MEGINNVNVDFQRLERLNKGTSFVNIEDRYTGKKFYIYVLLKVSQDLKEKEEEIEVETNLPIRDGNYRYYGSNFSVKEFLEVLKKFVKLPLAKIRIPLKSEISSYQLGSLEENIRKETIMFSDINIQVGELAKKKLKRAGIKDFDLEIERILNLQDNTSHQEIQDRINAYVQLRDKISFLKNLLCKKSDYGYYYREEEKDNTIKLPLTPEEYNEKLKEIEKELRVLEKDFNLREFDLEYEKIKDEHTFENWLKENEEQLREDFEANQEEDSEMTFDEYAEMVFGEQEE